MDIAAVEAQIESLQEQALVLGSSGDIEGAVDVTKRQVELARQSKVALEKEIGFDAPNRRLAEALHALASYQHTAGSTREAIAAAKEAVSEWGRDTFLNAPQQAQSLGLLSIIQSQAGLADEALATAEAAWAQLSRWPATESWLRRLKAGMATDLSVRRSDCGHFPEAIAAAAEAIALWEPLVTEDTGDMPHLARALHSLAVSLWWSGAGPEAVETITAAIRTYRQVASAQAAECAADLAAAERALANMN